MSLTADRHFPPVIMIILIITLIILINKHDVMCYKYPYRAFDKCGLNGWTCENTTLGCEVTYTCFPHDRVGRFWIWTARVPRITKVITVRECDEVELHFDCTTGYRAHKLRLFRVINNTNVTALRPLRPGIFLHDNDMFAQMPPEIIFDNIERLEFNVPIPFFDKPPSSSRCQPYQFASFTIKDVKSLDVSNEALRCSSELTSVNIINTTFESKYLPKISLDFKAKDLILANCSFTTLKTRSISFTGVNVLLSHNNIENVIEEEALMIRARNFTFNNNYVGNVAKRAFNSLALYTNLISNTFKSLDSDAFSLIGPGIRTGNSFLIPGRFLYNFTGNTIHKPALNSLPPNMERYHLTCADLFLDNNYFTCLCENNTWSPNLNTNNTKFYESLVFTGYNKCIENGTLLKCAFYTEGRCEQFSELMEKCTMSSTSQPLDYTERGEFWTENDFDKDILEVTEFFIYDNSTVGDYGDGNEAKSMARTAMSDKELITVIVCAALAALAGSVVVFVVYYRRKKLVSALSHRPVYHSACCSKDDDHALIEEHEV